MSDIVYLEWLKETMMQRPEGNEYLDSERGFEVGKLCLEFEKSNFNWRRSDPEIFWIDVALFTKYKLDDDEIRFILKMQMGLDNHVEHAEERKAYAEVKRGLEKLKNIYRKQQGLPPVNTEVLV